jgi:hypothetical protein
MNLTKKISAIALLGLMSVGANAEFLTIDALALNDNKALIDTTTGIEWMKLGQTRNMSLVEAQGLLSTTYLGWRLPTKTEVEAMMHDITGIVSPVSSDYISLRSSQYKDEAVRYINLFQTTYISSNHKYSHGVYLNDEGEALQTTAYYDSRTGSDKIGEVTLGNTSNANLASWNYGIYLVSDGGASFSSINDPSINANNANSPANSVPVPASISLLGLALLGMQIRRKSNAS